MPYNFAADFVADFLQAKSQFFTQTGHFVHCPKSQGQCTTIILGSLESA